MDYNYIFDNKIILFGSLQITKYLPVYVELQTVELPNNYARDIMNLLGEEDHIKARLE